MLKALCNSLKNRRGPGPFQADRLTQVAIGLRQIPLLNSTIGRPAPGRAALVDDAEKHLGRNLARLRLAKGFTQERFAEVSGVTQQYVSDLERGLRNQTVVTLYNLASALGVSHVELVMPDDEALRESAKPPRRKPGKT